MIGINQFSSIGRNMNVADKYFRLYLRDALNPYGLNTAEGTVLLSMFEKSGGTEKQIFDSIHGREGGGNTQDELIGELHYDKGVMTRTMKALEDKGFVQRRDNPEDSRSYIFSLTENGKNMKSVLLDILRKWNAVLLDGVPEDSLAVLEGALDIMAKNAVRFCRDKKHTHSESEEKGNQHLW